MISNVDSSEFNRTLTCLSLSGSSGKEENINKTSELTILVIDGQKIEHVQ